MKIENFSQLLALISWVSVFVEAWLLILRAIPADGLAFGFFALFFFVAVMAGAVASTKKEAVK